LLIQHLFQFVCVRQLLIHRTRFDRLIQFFEACGGLLDCLFLVPTAFLQRLGGLLHCCLRLLGVLLSPVKHFWMLLRKLF